MTGRARIADGDLSGLDRLEIDALAMHLHAERRQPRGVAGYIDWRLCGRIARMIIAGTFAGRPEETLLMPSLGRIGAERIFLFGLGRRGKIDMAERARETAQVLLDACVQRVALVGTTELLAAWLEHAPAGFEEVLVLDADDALDHAELEAAARAGGFDWA